MLDSLIQGFVLVQRLEDPDHMPIFSATFACSLQAGQESYDLPVPAYIGQPVQSAIQGVGVVTMLLLSANRISVVVGKTELETATDREVSLSLPEGLRIACAPK